MGYRANSKKDCDGKRKNFGLNGLHDHLEQCKAKPKINLNNNQTQRTQTALSINQPKFAYYKKSLPDQYKSKLKDAELKFVVTGSHSFNLLENYGILNLVQTGIEIDANVGLIDVKDIFYGRQTIRQEALSKFEQYTNHIRSLSEQPFK